MTDLELTKACAEAMGLRVQLIAEPKFHFADCPYYCIPTPTEAPNPKYDPLHDDTQAMALVKKFHLHIGYNDINKSWYVAETLAWWKAFLDKSVFNTDLNHAIVECVAKLQQAKQEGGK